MVVYIGLAALFEVALLATQDIQKPKLALGGGKLRESQVQGFRLCVDWGDPRRFGFAWIGVIKHPLASSLRGCSFLTGTNGA